MADNKSNILFLSLSTFMSINEKNAGIYADLMREFVRNGHKVYRIFPVDVLKDKSRQIYKEPGQVIVKIPVGKIRGSSNMITKGIHTILLEPRMKAAIKKYYKDVHFDLILYATPPVTFYSAVKYIKKRDRALSYLMLKDIFPQGSVDIGLMNKRGIKGLIYLFFRKKEKQLYKISDYIGCMSEANIKYLLEHNTVVKKSKVELFPNSIDAIDFCISEEEKKKNREKYKIPEDKVVFVYGGNLGKPQGIPFIIEMLEHINLQRYKNTVLNKAYFIIVGDGSESHTLENYYHLKQPDNMLLMEKLKQDEYDCLIRSCDVGLIFLDHRFTIPNFPSRLLSYMQAKMPVLCFTDPVTDIGETVVQGGFGWKGESDDAGRAAEIIEEVCNDFSAGRIEKMKENSWQYLINNFAVSNVYTTVMKHCTENRVDG